MCKVKDTINILKDCDPEMPVFIEWPCDDDYGRYDPFIVQPAICEGIHVIRGPHGAHKDEKCIKLVAWDVAEKQKYKILGDWE